MSNKRIRTVQGEMWDMYAKKYLGGEHGMRDIVDINVEYADVLVFSGEAWVDIPTDKKIEPERTLPPWEM